MVKEIRKFGNMKCQTCGSTAHYCTNCDYDKYLSKNYCSKECFEQSREYKLFKRELEEFYCSLNFNQKLEFWSLYDNYIFCDDLYEEMADEIIKNPRNE